MSIPYAGLIEPVLAHLAVRHGVRAGPAAGAMLVAIGLQESNFALRDQRDAGPPVLGPATGFWQFERAGGVRGVMTHPASAAIARAVAAEEGILFEEDAIWHSFGKPVGDRLACAFARLLLLTDPRPLPHALPEAEEEAWDCYVRNWRPGKPHRHRWASAWGMACRAVLAPA